MVELLELVQELIQVVGRACLVSGGEGFQFDVGDGSEALQDRGLVIFFELLLKFLRVQLFSISHYIDKAVFRLTEAALVHNLKHLLLSNLNCL